jgi:hypothetical protein
MKIKIDKTYWIIFSVIRKKYPHYPVEAIHIVTHKVIEKSRHNKKEPKGLTADIVTIDEFPLKEG